MKPFNGLFSLFYDKIFALWRKATLESKHQWKCVNVNVQTYMQRTWGHHYSSLFLHVFPHPSLSFFCSRCLFDSSNVSRVSVHLGRIPSRVPASKMFRRLRAVAFVPLFLSRGGIAGWAGLLPPGHKGGWNFARHIYVSTLSGKRKKLRKIVVEPFNPFFVLRCHRGPRVPPSETYTIDSYRKIQNCIFV